MKKKTLAAAIVWVSMFQMGMVALSPVVASITAAFPGVSQATAQSAMTFLCLVLVIVALFSGVIARCIGRRWMAAAGMLLTAAAGAGGAFLTSGLWTVFLWSAMLGAGTGLFVPAVSSLMLDFFDDRERDRIAGVQTAFVNLGGMLLSFFSGMLAARGWQYAYLVFLAAIPVAFLVLGFIPGDKQDRTSHRKEKQGKLPAVVWLAAGQTFLFAMLYFAFSTNISLLLAERGMDSTSLAGTATSVFMLGGCLFGFLFTRVAAFCGSKTPSLAFLLVAASYFVIYFTEGIAPLLLAAFAGGGSLSLIFPYFLIAVAGKAEPSVSVVSASLIVSVGPNLGSFLSPLVLTNLSNALFGPAADARLLLAAGLAAALAVVWIPVSRAT